MADFMSRDAHEKLRQDLLSALSREPPPRCSQAPMSPLRRADEEAFAIMARLAKGGIRRIAGWRPLGMTIGHVIGRRDYKLAL